MVRFITVCLVLTLVLFSQSKAKNILGAYQFQTVIGTIEVFMSYTFLTDNIVIWKYYSKATKRESSFQLKGTYQINKNYISVHFLHNNKVIEDKFEIINKKLLKGSDGLLFEKSK